LISDFSLGWLDKRDTSKPFFMVIGEKATHRNWMPAVEDLGAYDAQQFPMPDNFFDTYEGRTAALEQDMTVNKTMTIGDDLKMNINYDKPGMFGRLTPAEKLAYKTYYGKIALEYDKVKSDSIALIKWKYQRYLKDYLATARSLDRNIGRILAYLEKSGLAENTVVMYASDQGFYMGEHGWFDKRFMYEESLKTPVVLKYPKHIKPGTVVNDIVVNIDFAPTFLDIAGVKAPAEMQGKSFLPLVTKSGKVENWRTAMYYHYYEYPQPHKVPPHFGIRTMRYKLIRFYGPRSEWELYDLKTDPTEMHNIINDQGKVNTILDLKKQLRSLIVEYKDTEALQILNSN
jgi:arylsulfatase A-like enzyme